MKKTSASVVLSSFLVKNTGRLAAKLISRKTVSYTHLTLPTNKTNAVSYGAQVEIWF